MTRCTTTAIIPALDEEASIGQVVAGINRQLVDEIIVGDNGSRDRTADLARAAGAVVVHVPEQGYGAACAAALAAMSPATELVVFVDADGSDDLEELPRLLEPLREGRADLVIGSRVLGRVEPGAMTPPQRFGTWFAAHLIHAFYDHRYTDLGPFRAIRRSLLDRIDMKDRRFGWTVEMQIRALQEGARVEEVPVSYRRRIGRSKISGTVSGVLKAGWWILWTIWRLRKRRVQSAKRKVRS